jgi:hypothetical protein
VSIAAAPQPAEGERFTARRHPFAVVPTTELIGPRTGHITLPLHVQWSGGVNTYDIEDDLQRRTAYKYLLEEGLAEDLRRLVNPGLLAADLPHLIVREEIKSAWRATLAGPVRR